MVRRQFKLGTARRFSNHPCRFAFADQRRDATVAAAECGRHDVLWVELEKVLDGTGNEQDCFFLVGIRTAVQWCDDDLADLEAATASCVGDSGSAAVHQ